MDQAPVPRPSTSGRLYYRCRLCGGLFEIPSAAVRADLQEVAVLGHAARAERQLIEVHYCGTAIGLADLIGGRIDESPRETPPACGS